jgi:hypothetical protein
MTKLIGYLGGTRIDYQGYPTKGGFLPNDMNLALEAMRKAKKRGGIHFNARWKETDYIEKIYDNGEKSIIKMKDVWQGRL